MSSSGKNHHSFPSEEGESVEKSDDLSHEDGK
jgi:hypothetical protein